MARSQLSAKDLGFKSDSFTTDFPDDVANRLILIVQAGQKIGKTDFAIRNVPDPIVIHNFDQGLEGVVGKHRRKGKTIIVAGVPSTRPNQFPSYHFARPIPDRSKGEGRKSEGYLERIKKAATPIWERFINDYHEALESKKIRSIVVDTGGGAFQLGKFAFHGMDKVTSKDDPYGQKGGELKSIFQGLMADGYSYDKNVIWLHRISSVWEGGQPVSGKWKPAGYSDAPYEVQATLFLKKNRDGERTATVVDSRIGKNGHVYEGDDFGFAQIAADLTRTDVSEWE